MTCYEQVQQRGPQGPEFDGYSRRVGVYGHENGTTTFSLAFSAQISADQDVRVRRVVLDYGSGLHYDLTPRQVSLVLLTLDAMCSS